MNDVGDLYALMRQAQSQRDAATARAEAAEAALKQAQADGQKLSRALLTVHVAIDANQTTYGSADAAMATAELLAEKVAQAQAERDAWRSKWEGTIDDAVCGLSKQLQGMESDRDKLRADLAAAKQALRDATEWRPIETAPRDGTWVFTRDKHDPAQPIACRWRQDCKAWQDFFGEVWASETHWLPIPPFAQEAQPS